MFHDVIHKRAQQLLFFVFFYFSLENRVPTFTGFEYLRHFYREMNELGFFWKKKENVFIHTNWMNEIEKCLERRKTLDHNEQDIMTMMKKKKKKNSKITAWNEVVKNMVEMRYICELRRIKKQ